VRQITLAAGTLDTYRKPTRRERFLAEMDKGVAWQDLCAMIAPYYPKGENGQPPVWLERMLRIYCLEQWFNRNVTEPRLRGEGPGAPVHRPCRRCLDGQPHDFGGISPRRASAPRTMLFDGRKTALPGGLPPTPTCTRPTRSAVAIASLDSPIAAPRIICARRARRQV
jgi:IS5 family transposase